MISDRWREDQSTEASDAAERALLGCILLVPDLLVAAETLRPEDFRSPTRGMVLDGARRLEEAGTPIDSITVAARLEHGKKTAPAGGWWPACISLLDAIGVPDEDICREYARIILEASTTRRRATRTLSRGH